MIKYVKKEDLTCKYFIKYNTETRDAIAVYRNKDGSRFGINCFKCFPIIYDSPDYSISSESEFSNKLDIIRGLIK